MSKSWDNKWLEVLRIVNVLKMEKEGETNGLICRKWKIWVIAQKGSKGEGNIISWR